VAFGIKVTRNLPEAAISVENGTPFELSQISRVLAGIIEIGE
jgi:hypothetical protein